MVGPGTLIAFEPGAPLAAHANAHIGFEVPTRDLVAGLGATLRAPLEEAPRSASTRVRDPEGNAIEIYWEPDGPASVPEGFARDPEGAAPADGTR